MGIPDRAARPPLDPLGHWLADVRGVTPAPPLQGEVRADVVIVGGGYAGLWTAWALAERAPEARVVVLEARRCGEGPSGRNAGFVNSFWYRLEELAPMFGTGAAIELCVEADRSIDAIGHWASRREVDLWFRKDGHIKVATSAAQEPDAVATVEAAERLGVPERCSAMSAEQVRARCDSPLFRGGSFTPDCASVQPARLALGLRAAVIEAGVTVHEHTPARRLRPGPGGEVAVETATGGRVVAGTAVVAINAATAGFDPLRGRIAVSSTHMVVTEPVPDVIEDLGWTGGECISTARTYLHYMRTTPDGRIAFGFGGGRIAYGARLGGRVERDPIVVDRVCRDLLEFFPGLRGRRIERAWGGPIDVSPNRLPAIGTLADGRTHYVYGFTGNGVGPAHLAGRIISSLCLDVRDAPTRLPIVEPDLARVPPEPLRYLGGEMVRAAMLRREDRIDLGLPARRRDELIVGLPRRLGIHVGR
jgi:glycine/D-amino acid oxidase-like deaminating enzyme